MIIKAKERLSELEVALKGKFWIAKTVDGLVYVIKGKLPDEVKSTLPEGSCIDIRGSTPLASREIAPDGTRVRIGDAEFGGNGIVVCAGPCGVESREQLFMAARSVKEAGAGVLRGGAFKPRTSPYSFQGLGEEGLKLLREASDALGIPVLTEATNAEQVGLVARYADAIQIGARNMQSFDLLRAAGRAGVPVVLKRGISATIDEWLQAAEYVLLEGNPNVILCERGIRTFETATRNVLDTAGIALMKLMTHLPVIADPSHATGRVELVAAASRAAIAAGADGILVEVHPNPAQALSDGPQSLTPDQFRQAVAGMRSVAKAVGRS